MAKGYTQQDLKEISTKEGYLNWLKNNVGITEASPATQVEVDAGINTTKFVNPSTLANWSGGGGGLQPAIKKTFTAGENIGGGQVVMLTGDKIFKFVPSNPSNCQKVIGVTNQAGAINDSVDVILQGVCTQMGGLTAGIVYYASTTAGLLSSTAPSIGIVQVVGIAENATTLIVSLEKPYIKI